MFFVLVDHFQSAQAWASVEIFPGGGTDIFHIFFSLLMVTIRSATRRGNRATVPSPENNKKQENISWLRPYDDGMQILDVNKTLYAFYKTHRCRTNQIFGCAEDILSECPKFIRETFVQQTFSLQLSVAIGRLSFYLTCCHKLEKLVLEIWFLIIQLRKVR